MGSHKTSATLLNKRGRDGILELKKEIKKQFDNDLTEMLGSYEIMPFVGYEEGVFEYFSVDFFYLKPNTKEKVKRLDFYLVGKTVDELIYAINIFILGYKTRGQI